jgi:hypothetical protein
MPVLTFVACAGDGPRRKGTMSSFAVAEWDPWAPPAMPGFDTASATAFPEGSARALARSAISVAGRRRMDRWRAARAGWWALGVVKAVSEISAAYRSATLRRCG